MPYTSTDQEVTQLIDKWGNEHAHRMGLKSLKIDTIFYFAKKNAANERVGPPLKLHGYACYATIKVQSELLRAQGLGDAIVTLDQDAWEALKDAEKEALIDHELEHLESVKVENAPVMDDQGRPKLKLKLHDWHIEGFKVVVERHKENALECRAAHEFAVSFGQLLFPWAVPQRPSAAKRKAG